MDLIASFPPEAKPDAKVLILGSIPGKASLLADQYYAHPRNHFWPIVCELLAIDPAHPYQSRILSLTSARIALWDVVKYCHRHNSSLDSKIDPTSVIVNDFLGFFTTHPHITHIFFNGFTAEKTFQKHIHRDSLPRVIRYQRLPSTSPANATTSFQKKLQEWRVLTNVLENSLAHAQCPSTDVRDFERYRKNKDQA